MAYTVKLGTFAKKINSTAQPDMTGWAEFSVVLKQGSELTDPTLQLNVNESDIVNYNYAYMFGSYYWITSRKMVRTDLCELKLEKDVLASYKLEIGSSNLYVTRSSISYDGGIKDAYYPMKVGKTYANDTTLDSATYTLNDGCYVVNVLGNDSVSNSTFYLMTPIEFTSFIKKLFADCVGYFNGDIGQALVNDFFDPINYIRSVMWFPFSKATMELYFGALSTGSYNIHCGLWDGGQPGEYLTTCCATVGYWSIPLTKHPQASYRGDYLNGSPYTDHVIDFEPFGLIHVPADRLIEANSLSISLIVDVVSGEAILQAAGDISGNSTGTIVSVSAQYGVPIPIGQGVQSIGSLVNTVTGMAEFMGGLIPGNPLISALGAKQGIENFGKGIIGTVSDKGSQGSLAAFQRGKEFYTIFRNIVDEDNSNYGRPLCQVTQPALLGGYMVADKAPLSISAPLPELNKISQYITTGFYYE